MDNTTETQLRAIWISDLASAIRNQCEPEYDDDTSEEARAWSAWVQVYLREDHATYEAELEAWYATEGYRAWREAADALTTEALFAEYRRCFYDGYQEEAE